VRSEAERQLRKSCRKPTEKVEDYEGDMPETIFHIVAEDPQVQHVASQVKPPGMHEHGSEERRKITSGIGKEAAWDEGIPSNKSVTATLLQKNTGRSEQSGHTSPAEQFFQRNHRHQSGA